MANKLVLAFFENEAKADHAVNEIKAWDKGRDQYEVHGIGVMVKDEKGRIKTHKLGQRYTAGGSLLFMVAALLTGGAAIGLGMVGGMIAGAGLGSLFHKGLKISKEEMEQINRELDSGKAAVGAMIEAFWADDLLVKLTDLGGQPAAYEVSDEAMAEAKRAAEAAPEEPDEGAAAA